MAIKDYGPVTAYSLAVEAGFTGTFQEWVQAIGGAAGNAADAQQALSDAQDVLTTVTGYKNAMETALGTIQTGAAEIVNAFGDVDSTLSGSSANPIQNQAVYNAVNDLKDAINDIDYAFVYIESDNLVNVSTLHDGYMGTNGAEESSTSYKYTDNIAVTPGDVIKFYGYNQYGVNRQAINSRFICAFNANGEAVSASGSSASVNSYTVPTGIVSIVVTFAVSYLQYKILVTDSIAPDGYTNYKTPYNVIKYDSMPFKYQKDMAFTSRSMETQTGTDKIDLPATNCVKNVIYSYSASLSSFVYLQIGQGTTETFRSFINIDATKVTFNVNGNEYEFEHGLTIADYISVTISVNDNTKATVVIISNGGTYSKTLGWYGIARDTSYYAKVGQTMTNVDFTVSLRDAADADTFVFGDSYVAILESTSKWTHWLVDDGFSSKVLINACPGISGTETLPALSTILNNYGKPKYLLWAIGMNDGADSDDTPNTAWKTCLDSMLDMCSKYDITPVLATIPTVSTINHEAKNAWIRASNYRYIDFAKAVGAQSNGTWYTGLLSQDGVHPSELGAKALWQRVLIDFPEITM